MLTKGVLCARSPVFASMLATNMQRKINEHCIQVEDLEDSTIDQLLLSFTRYPGRSSMGRCHSAVLCCGLLSGQRLKDVYFFHDGRLNKIIWSDLHSSNQTNARFTV
ncbi:hypothetical protein AVEN_254390-1 [Araneus ventricosus]|uniref:BTB domain-containing protein n=1 Tax=Araneus ventricosus TaxID=182803 RepID=A0A4Y2UWU8_ARAVE|nr:hypothetical protein AVEN_254390-1 [Araneus ventricosus]